MVGELGGGLRWGVLLWMFMSVKNCSMSIYIIRNNFIGGRRVGLQWWEEYYTGSINIDFKHCLKRFI